MIHGHTSSGRAWTVIARVALNCARGTTSSPGIGAVTSPVAAPQRMCHGLSTGLTTQTGTAVNASNNMPIFVEGAFGTAARAVTDTRDLPSRPTCS